MAPMVRKLLLLRNLKKLLKGGVEKKTAVKAAVLKYGWTSGSNPKPKVSAAKDLVPHPAHAVRNPHQSLYFATTPLLRSRYGYSLIAAAVYTTSAARAYSSGVSKFFRNIAPSFASSPLFKDNPVSPFVKDATPTTATATAQPAAPATKQAAQVPEHVKRDPLYQFAHLGANDASERVQKAAVGTSVTDALKAYAKLGGSSKAAKRASRKVGAGSMKSLLKYSRLSSK